MRVRPVVWDTHADQAHRILLDLNVPDAVWVFLDTQHKYIMEQMQESHKKCKLVFDGEPAALLLPVADGQTRYNC